MYLNELEPSRLNTRGNTSIEEIFVKYLMRIKLTQEISKSKTKNKCITLQSHYGNGIRL